MFFLRPFLGGPKSVAMFVFLVGPTKMWFFVFRFPSLEKKTILGGKVVWNDGWNTLPNWTKLLRMM